MRIFILIVISIFITNLTYSQSGYSSTELNEMLKTYSFYLGQLTSVNGIIEKYPSLNLEVNNAQNLWNLKFRASIENIISELKANMGDEFTDFEDELLSTMSQADYTQISLEDAKSFITTINERTKGDMPSPFLETLLSFNPTYQNNPEKEMIDGFINEYFTKESIKSEGLNIKIKYPKSWKSENGDRPHVVQKFTSDNGHGLEGALIMLMKTKVTLSKNDINLLLSEEGLKYQLPKSSKVISINTGLKIDNVPAASITFYQEQPQMNLKIGMISETYILYYNDYQISFMLNVGSTSDKYDEIYERYETNKRLFWRMANNLVILSQYE